MDTSKFPTVVCLCGSTRFLEQFREAEKQETLAGRIVLSIGVAVRDSDPFWADKDQVQVKEELDWLHKRKIDMSNEILVINVDGYYGDSTRSEIEYAQKTGKPIRWWEQR
jgi:hypothetical protein